MIFGSEKFIPLVGELKLASQMQDHEPTEPAVGADMAAQMSAINSKVKVGS